MEERKQYLFICNWKQNRSPMAVRITKERALSKGLEVDASCLALFPEESREYDEKDKRRIKSAYRVFVMTDEMLELVRTRYRVSRDYVVLGVPDEYNCYDPIDGERNKLALEKILREKLEEWV